ncbi:MAG: hypothetical protein ACKKMP_02530 [Candidatus Nealsonbacteria bacterium]
MIPAAPSVPSFTALVLGYLWQIFRIWWWLPAPFILWKPFAYLWDYWKTYWWIRTVYKPILMEIKLPKETVKPMRAMEDVMNSFHSSVYHPPDWWEKHIDGQIQTSIAFEIVSLGGDIHFYIRCHEGYRDAVEASLYAQYPEAEITTAEDYTKAVPQDIPNDNWNMWATDYKVLQADYYPIATYKQFETEREVLEEKRIDPVATLLEGLSKVKPGEQFWIQMACSPMSEGPAIAWRKEAEAERDKIAKRDVKTAEATKPMLLEAADVLITGKLPEEKIEEVTTFLPPEMKLTPGERIILAGLEEKMSKPIFNTNIRFIFLGKREFFYKGNFRLGFAFFGSYTTTHLNALVPFGPTLSKIKKGRFLPINVLIPRRLYLRNRRMFRNYITRLHPLFPRTPPKSAKFKLNTEELASLFHLPSYTIAPVPAVSRVEAKRTAPPKVPTK